MASYENRKIERGRADDPEDGIGPVKTAREARQGFWGAPVLWIMIWSLTLAGIAAILLWLWIAF